MAGARGSLGGMTSSANWLAFVIGVGPYVAAFFAYRSATTRMSRCRAVRPPLALLAGGVELSSDMRARAFATISLAACCPCATGVRHRQPLSPGFAWDARAAC
jgi:hypothetical protein